jgi:hypothetical protein
VDQNEVNVNKAITEIRAHLSKLERDLILGEGIFKGDAEKTIELARDLRDAIAGYMGEE